MFNTTSQISDPLAVLELRGELSLPGVRVQLGHLERGLLLHRSLQPTVQVAVYQGI